MAELVKLTELEAYRQEALNAEREGRPCTLKDPREVYKEDPNAESFLVELDKKELKAAQEEVDSRNAEKLQNMADNVEARNENRLDSDPEITDETLSERLPTIDEGETARRVELEHGLTEDLYPEPHVTSLPDVSAAVMQEVQEDLALKQTGTESTHQNTQSTPNPEFVGGQPSEEDQELDGRHANLPDEAPTNSDGDGELRNSPEADELNADGRTDSHLEGTVESADSKDK